ncbi:hypothetical protein [Nostoc sp. FACHB-110]|uniref:hypothetical protein n=1 Tax=Nostoc sp. FACHB-110 TaxID=2692834 RepID=UPI0016864CE4|nr:hypothetical protein [Nostoc sp. FACHB-110]MBD2436122.1 hypothetical protein [Nostoc sp. FACHB-110]
MLHINLNKIAGNHVEQSFLTDNLNQYQLRSLTDEKIPSLILQIKHNHIVTMHRLSDNQPENLGEQCIKISCQPNKKHLLSSLTTVAQLH